MCVCVFTCTCAKSHACVSLGCWLHDSVEDSMIGFMLSEYGFGHRQNVTWKMSPPKCHCSYAPLCVCVCVGGCMLTHTLTAHPVSRHKLSTNLGLLSWQHHLVWQSSNVLMVKCFPNSLMNLQCCVFWQRDTTSGFN